MSVRLRAAHIDTMKKTSLKTVLAAAALLALPLTACTTTPGQDPAPAASQLIETPPAALENAIEAALAEHENPAVATDALIELADMRRAYPFHEVMSPANSRLEAMETQLVEGTVDRTMTEAQLMMLARQYALTVQHAAVQYGVLEMPGS